MGIATIFRGFLILISEFMGLTPSNINTSNNIGLTVRPIMNIFIYLV